MPNVIMLNVVMLIVIFCIVVRIVVMLNVVAPLGGTEVLNIFTAFNAAF
jgi:hypothetical protein